jgi:S2P endopeptidase
VVITKLNDFPLASPNQHVDSDVWSQYFLEYDSIPESESGWCVEEEWFLGEARNASHIGPLLTHRLDHNSSCCSSQTSRDYAQSCFAASAHGTGTSGRCIDPVPLLTQIDDSNRCSVVQSCNSTFVCVRPSTNEQLLRIRFGSAGSEKLVLWSGPALEVWEQGNIVLCVLIRC